MSSIWTPSGEYQPTPTPAEQSSADLPGSGDGHDFSDETGRPAPSQEELEAIREIQSQIRATPAAAVVANHVIQLFELAVVYLGVATPPDDQGRVPHPDLAQAGVAIDAMSALIDGLGARYGENEETLRDALGQIQMLYVQVADALGEETH